MKLTLENLQRTRAVCENPGICTEIDDHSNDQPLSIDEHVKRYLPPTADTRTITGLRLGGGSVAPPETYPEYVARVRVVPKPPLGNPLAGFGDVPYRDTGACMALAHHHETDAATVGDVRANPTDHDVGCPCLLCRGCSDWHPPVPCGIGGFASVTASDYKTAPAGGGLSVADQAAVAEYGRKLEPIIAEIKAEIAGVGRGWWPW